MHFEKSINLFEMKKDYVPWLFIIQLFFYLFVNNFSVLLLWKINVFDIFDMSDLFQIFVISRSAEILIESNFWLGMYVPYILKSMWNVYGCERDRTNFAILNFSTTFDLFEKRRERSSAELLEGELRFRLSSERSNVREKFRLQVFLSTVLFHMLLRRG